MRCISFASMTMYDSSHKMKNKLAVTLALGAAFLVGLFVDFLMEQPPVPVLLQKRWGDKTDTHIRPFKINISDDVIDDLNTRLFNTRDLIMEAASTNLEYGLSPTIIEDFLDYWSNNYNWTSRQQYLNKYQHFKTAISGLDIHFMHVKSSSEKPKLPLLMVHGWPGTFKDFYGLVPYLTNNTSQEYDIELIVPSLPGYSFSDSPKFRMPAGSYYAQIFNQLMQRLGYGKYYIFGADWGSAVVQDMAVLYPDNILGLYSPFCLSLRKISNFKFILESLIPDAILPRERKCKYSVFTAIQKLTKEAAYLHFHVTKPDSLGVGLNDSPLGLAAYILQIYAAGNSVDEYTNTVDGTLKSDFSYDDLIDTIMLFWTTNSITSTLRSYVDFYKGVLKTYQIPISSQVPCMCAKFKKEIFYQSDWILRDKYTNLMERSEFSGGHFFFLENNESHRRAYAEDILLSISKMRKFRT